MTGANSTPDHQANKSDRISRLWDACGDLETTLAFTKPLFELLRQSTEFRLDDVGSVRASQGQIIALQVAIDRHFVDIEKTLGDFYDLAKEMKSVEIA